jgi:hypothetical protein
MEQRWPCRNRFERRFVVVMESITPLSRTFTADQRAASLFILRNFLGSKKLAIRAGARAFVALLALAAWIRHGRRLRALSDARREALLRSFMDSPIPILRKGFWGISTLAKLACYGQPSTYATLGYRPRAIGPARDGSLA